MKYPQPYSLEVGVDLKTPLCPSKTKSANEEALDELAEKLAKEIDILVINKIHVEIATRKLPSGYRIMNKGEFPNYKNGDLAYSFRVDPKWGVTTMSGTYPIRDVPIEGLLWATKIQ